MKSFQEKRVVIYLGPSLALPEARKILDVEYRPPIRRGDLEVLLADPPSIIGIVDGMFAQSLAISTKEILRIIDKGAMVLGSSSMGALRATELSPYGMKGIGTVFEMYSSGEIDADDEVALTHDEHGQPLSEAMVNIRCALQDALEKGIISASEKRYLLHSAKSLYFPERSYERLFQMAHKKLPETVIQKLQLSIQEQKPNAKRDDAVLLLEYIRELAA